MGIFFSALAFEEISRALTDATAAAAAVSAVYGA